MEALPRHNNNGEGYHVLEIGCGTSTLSRDFWRVCRQESTKRDLSSVSVCATDVSSVCIEQNQQRDQEDIQREQQPMMDYLDASILEYRVLNIAEPLFPHKNNGDDDNHPNGPDNSKSTVQPKSFDMIIDKGCLDTFAFRTRQRGDQKNVLVQSVLDNVFDLLKDGDNDNNTEPGVYVSISPRAKFRALQKYPGFSKVQRIPLGVGKVKAELMESNAHSNNSHGQDSPDDSKKERETLYMYVCTKQPNFHPQQGHQRNQLAMVPEDSEACPVCGVKFHEFRKGEDINGRGGKFWTRIFRGHTRHCKG
eukprot:Sro1683_g290910.1 n/a (307) ;mRNA; r:6289-7209